MRNKTRTRINIYKYILLLLFCCLKRLSGCCHTTTVLPHTNGNIAISLVFFSLLYAVDRVARRRSPEAPLEVDALFLGDLLPLVAPRKC